MPDYPSEHLFDVHDLDNDSWFAVRRCLICGEILDLVDQRLHRDAHTREESTK